MSAEVTAAKAQNESNSRLVLEEVANVDSRVLLENVAVEKWPWTRSMAASNNELRAAAVGESNEDPASSWGEVVMDEIVVDSELESIVIPNPNCRVYLSTTAEATYKQHCQQKQQKQQQQHEQE